MASSWWVICKSVNPWYQTTEYKNKNKSRWELFRQTMKYSFEHIKNDDVVTRI